MGPEVKILEIGGMKKMKRGLFDAGRYGAEVKYVNIDATTEPDIVSDAAAIPLPDASQDVVILGEVLEHVYDPVSVLKETSRLLRPGGSLLATVPFIYPIHAHPDDYGRYTDSFWKRAARQAAFREVEIETQGSIFAVAALMTQHIFRAKRRSWRPIQNSLIRLFMWLDRRTSNELLKAWTTGFGLILTK